MRKILIPTLVAAFGCSMAFVGFPTVATAQSTYNYYYKRGVTSCGPCTHTYVNSSKPCTAGAKNCIPGGFTLNGVHYDGVVYPDVLR